MLDAETKRRIDTARDILVGKVPDPKSQVEQITIALIYKFMDDMDAQSEELGGKRGFFADAFARYGWAKLMRGGLGGYEMLALYAEAIAKMPENPGIPPLFRNIFNNAFLPYRDPETLRAFLKVIDEFTYDHPERLGDAYEYLLSVLGSQGDAGQFRTPAPHHRLHRRHSRSEKGRDRARPGLWHGGISDLVLQAHSRGEHGRRRPQHADDRRQGPTRYQLQGLRHFAGYGAPVAGEYVPARVRRAANL